MKLKDNLKGLNNFIQKTNIRIIKSVKFFVIGCIIITIPYGLSVCKIAYNNINATYQSYRDKKINLEEENQKNKEIEDMNRWNEQLEASETKYRPYINTDTERYLKLVLDENYGTLSIKGYLNQSENEVVLNIVDSNLNEDKIISYKSDDVSNTILRFVNNSNVEHYIYDYKMGTKVFIKESPMGYTYAIDSFNKSDYLSNIVSYEDVNIDYSNLNVVPIDKISFEDDYYKEVYKIGVEKYLPILEDDISSLSSFTKFKICITPKEIISIEIFKGEADDLVVVFDYTSENEHYNYITAYKDLSTTRTESNKQYNIITSSDLSSYALQDTGSNVEMIINLNKEFSFQKLSNFIF